MPDPKFDGIVLAAYDPAWPAMFREEQVRLERAIGQWAVAIEHVGSTSIPGIDAKPIIDIGVALRTFEDALFCITPLVEIGYECLGEFGIPSRIYSANGRTRRSPGRCTTVALAGRTRSTCTNRLTSSS